MASVLLMMMSVLLFSIYPLLGAQAVERNDPVLFVMAAHVFCAAFAWLRGLQLLRRDHADVPASHLLRMNRKIWATVFVTGTASAINHSCLMLALLMTSKIGVTIIYETWPIIAAWLTPVLVAKGWQQVRRADYIFGLLAVIGVGLIFGSEIRAALPDMDFSAFAGADPDRLKGYALACIGGLGVAVSTTLRRNVSRHLREELGGDLLLGTYLSSALTRTATLPVFAALFFWLHDAGSPLLVPADLPLAALTGIGVYLMGSVAYAHSILRNPNPAIPVPDFLAPVLSVIWLYAFGYTDVSDVIILGGLFVITANLLVTVRAEDGFAYTASILALLLGGAYCYFTDGRDMENFYEAISVSAVFYAILIAFAWDRTLERTKHEESLALDITYSIEQFRQDSPKDGRRYVAGLVTHVNTIVSAGDRTVIGTAYRQLQDIRAALDPSPSLLKLYRDIDSLILSKTKDIMLSEIVLLCLIGGVTFFGILGYRPPGIWADMMAFIMAGAIVFIFFAIFDQVSDRKKQRLTADEKAVYIIHEGLFQTRSEFKLVTIALVAVMLCVFFGLFDYKYSMTP